VEIGRLLTFSPCSQVSTELPPPRHDSPSLKATYERDIAKLEAEKGQYSLETLQLLVRNCQQEVQDCLEKGFFIQETADGFAARLRSISP
jgi:hypothetical protein